MEKRGIGKSLPREAKKLVDELDGWVIVDDDSHLGAEETTHPIPLPFHLKNGFMTATSRHVKDKKLNLQEIIWKKRD